ncbi:MAG TPA: hypothetical protein VFX19_06035 [Dehalococcoidia bacterium]|nr:hypothetical protein [Dehalococcoidia bacterium]
MDLKQGAGWLILREHQYERGRRASTGPWWWTMGWLAYKPLRQTWY